VTLSEGQNDRLWISQQNVDLIVFDHGVHSTLRVLSIETLQRRITKKERQFNDDDDDGEDGDSDDDINETRDDEPKRKM
jgi:hypothetical protein